MSTFFERNGYTIHDLVQALGGGRTGARRDVPALLTDAVRVSKDRDVLTVHHIAGRLDLDTFTTRRVLDDLNVAHDGVYARASSLRDALATTRETAASGS